jgi:hypothetical protein
MLKSPERSGIDGPRPLQHLAVTLVRRGLYKIDIEAFKLLDLSSRNHVRVETSVSIPPPVESVDSFHFL